MRVPVNAQVTYAHRVFDTALKLLRNNPYGFLTTVHDGRPCSRLVQHLSVEDDATLWIGTSPVSRKAGQLAANPEVLYAVEDRGDLAYVVVYGAARLVVTFRPDTTEAELRRIVRGSGARSVGGPTVTNAWLIGADGQLDPVLARLRAEPAVTLAEPLSMDGRP